MAGVQWSIFLIKEQLTNLQQLCDDMMLIWSKILVKFIKI